MINITYSRHGDYLLPDIVLSEPPQEEVEPLTKYGLLRRSYLKKHKPIIYNSMLLSERLYPHLREIQKEANVQLERMMNLYCTYDPPPCKATDNLAWAAHMEALKHSVEEIIFAELIYS